MSSVDILSGRERRCPCRSLAGMLPARLRAWRLSGRQARQVWRCGVGPAVVHAHSPAAARPIDGHPRTLTRWRLRTLCGAPRAGGVADRQDRLLNQVTEGRRTTQQLTGHEVSLSDAERLSESATFAACVAAILEIPLDAVPRRPGQDAATDWGMSRWLGERVLSWRASLTQPLSSGPPSADSVTARGLPSPSRHRPRSAERPSISNGSAPHVMR
jgi:hypothetical protein